MNKGLSKLSLNRIKELEFNLPIPSRDSPGSLPQFLKANIRTVCRHKYTLQPFPAQHSNLSGKKKKNAAQD
jgi:hypothetical protein